MAITTRAEIAGRLSPTLSLVLGDTYREHATEYTQFLDVKKSEKGFEEVLMTAGLGLAQVKQEGGQIAIGNVQDTWRTRVQHQNIALGHSITEEAIDDDLYTDMGAKGAVMLGRSLAQTKEIRSAALLNNAFSGSFPIGDGKALVASDHPILDGTLDNLITGDMSETALKSVWVKTNAFLDEAGLKIAAKPQKLIITPNDYFTTVEILKSDKSTTTATLGATGITDTNNVNSLKSEGIFPGGMMVSHYLTDTDSFFVKTDVPNGLILWQRKPVRLKLKFEDMYTGNIVQVASERYSVMAADPRSILGSAGA